MCRNITGLRGLEPPATDQEIEAAAVQFVRKVTGVTTPKGMEHPAFQEAVRSVAAATHAALTELPPRRNPPRTQPPLRLPGHEAD